MSDLVLLRHGQSQWNQLNKFTGWTDVSLTGKGETEARQAGQILRENGFIFDFCFTSYLKRAIKTAWIVLEEMDLMWIPVEKSWRLNERHYGALQGEEKTQTAKKFGQEQVRKWRRSYQDAPPPLKPTDPEYPGNDFRYRHLEPTELPLTESLKMTVQRVIPYWLERIVPLIEKEQRVFICAHGNSLRGLVKYIQGISDNDITTFEIPTGVPLVYQISPDLKINSGNFLRI
ncbi:MAG TPA: 2,3-diphosphoglycerate-dependent phosphoglycerate mutase [Desulfohalobiaceae bacterium]|nr:2,3-diphosphoglycerate-dependent phosphoglycerate mutase [Desulfohalobiaceae bacterium]